MKIIIAGAGEVGFHLAKLLSYESQEIVLIDNNKENLKYAENHLDIRTINGNALSLSLLKNADVKSSDLFIGVTSQESLNITLCALAKQLGCKRTIARISNIEFISSKEEVSFKEMSNNKKFYEDKIQTAKFYFHRVLPRVESHYSSAISGSSYIMDYKFN